MGRTTGYPGPGEQRRVLVYPYYRVLARHLVSQRCFGFLLLYILTETGACGNSGALAFAPTFSQWTKAILDLAYILFDTFNGKNLSQPPSKNQLSKHKHPTREKIIAPVSSLHPFLFSSPRTCYEIELLFSQLTRCRRRKLGFPVPSCCFLFLKLQEASFLCYFLFESFQCICSLCESNCGLLNSWPNKQRHPILAANWTSPLCCTPRFGIAYQNSSLFS